MTVDPAAKPERHAPERMCIVSRMQKHPSEMIRFVVSPDQKLVPDIKGKLPGRGVYVSAQAQAVRQAMKKNAFAKALKQPIDVSKTLDSDIDQLLERSALQALAIANKAGAVVAGFAKIETALGKGKVIAILNAKDGAADGSRKLMQLARRSGAQISDLRLFDIAHLDAALGKSNVIHAAILTSAAGQFLIKTAERLQHYRADRVLQQSQENFCDGDEICDKADEISAE